MVLGVPYDDHSPYRKSVVYSGGLGRLELHPRIMSLTTEVKPLRKTGEETRLREVGFAKSRDTVTCSSDPVEYPGARIHSTRFEYVSQCQIAGTYGHHRDIEGYLPSPDLHELQGVPQLPRTQKF